MKRMGCTGMFFILILMLLIVGYDQWRIEQLRSEVAAISGKIHVGHGAKSASVGNSDLVTALAEVERCTREAKELLKGKQGKQVAQAQAKLDKVLRKLKSANSTSRDIVGDAAEFLGGARDNAVKVFQDAWTSITEEPKQSQKKK